MSGFGFNPDGEFAPVDVSGLGLTAEPAGATFSLAAAQVTDDGTATFNLTPSVDGDGMTFNLTPVLEQQGQQYSSAPDLDMSPFTRELAGQAIAFSPPLVSATSTTLTPDFTGLLPPPPPTHSAKTSPAGEPPTFSPPAFMEPFYGKSPGRPLTPPPPSQLSLLLQSPPRHSPPQYPAPPPPYKSPTYPALAPHHFSPEVVRLAPSVTLTKKPRTSVDASTSLHSAQALLNSLHSSATNPSLHLPSSTHASSVPHTSPLSSHSPSSPAPLLLQLTHAANPQQNPSFARPATSPRAYTASTSPRTQHISPLQGLPGSSPRAQPNTTPPGAQRQPSPRPTQISPRSSQPPHSSPGGRPSTSPLPALHIPLLPGQKPPGYSMEDIGDLPGINLRKGSVDLNTYVAAVARNMHSNFANIDSYAERCLACIVRKIRTNLPTLKALEVISRWGGGEEADPGCVLIPRMKDGRITIARPGGGAGGTKKIHPHLALVQIFKDPSVTNHNSLVSGPTCSSPFQGEGEVVCISPLHYSVEDRKTRVVVAPRRRDTEETRVRPPVQASAVDLMSDSDDEVDWVARWSTESVAPETAAIQEFNEEEILKQIQLLCLKSSAGGGTEYVAASDAIVKEMNVREDLMKLLKGKYNLEEIREAVKPKPALIKPPVPLLKAKRPYNRRALPKPSPKKKNLPEALASGDVGRGQLQPTAPPKAQPVVQEEAAPVKTEEDETVIQNLLDDIKGSFESQFEMDLDSFGTSVPLGPSFSSQDFGMTEAFALSTFDEDSFGSSRSPGRELFQAGPSGGVRGVASDAMFSGAGMEEPAGVAWSPAAQEFSNQEYLSGDSMSQDQFLKMFDDN